jgi:hypothetical protein
MGAANSLKLSVFEGLMPDVFVNVCGQFLAPASDLFNP